MSQLDTVLRPLVELLKVESPEDLTDAEIIRFREWLREAYEKAGSEPTEVEPEPVQAQPVKMQRAGAAHPNPEALAAIYERMSWFYAQCERERQAKSPADSRLSAMSLSFHELTTWTFLIH